MRLDLIEVQHPHVPVSRSGYDVVDSRLVDARTTIMGPLRTPVGEFKCYIKHHLGACIGCAPPFVIREAMLEPCSDASMYTIGAMRKKSEPFKLRDKDLIFLAWSCAKMAGHWGRLALGQEDLR